MNWFSDIFRREAKASASGAAYSLLRLNQPVWTDRNYRKLAREGYVRNSVANRCIHEISTSVGSVRWRLYQRRRANVGGGRQSVEEEILEHPLMDLLKRPNPMQSGDAFMEQLVTYYLIAGNTYIEAVMGGSIGKQDGPALVGMEQVRINPFMEQKSDGQIPTAATVIPASGGSPTELWVKEPQFMQVIAGGYGMPTGYLFRADGGPYFRYEADQTGKSPCNILHLKSVNPLNYWYGQPAIDAAANAIDRHNAASEWNLRLMQNDARPTMLITSKSRLEPDQIDQITEQVRKRFTGPRSEKTMILAGDVEVTEIGQTPKEMDWREGMLDAAIEIANVFGVPAIIISPVKSTFNNMAEARLAFWDQTVIPLVDRIAEELNHWLVPRFGDGLVLRPDYDEVSALEPRRQQKWEKVGARDVISVNEKRDAVGYDPVDGGDVVLVPAATTTLDILEAQEQQAEQGQLPSPEPAPASKSEIRLLGTGTR